MAWDVASQLLATTTLTASGTGNWLDSEGYTGTVSGVVLAQMWVGTVTGTNPTLDMYVEESDDKTNIFEAGKFNCGVPLTAVQLITATKTTTTQYQCLALRRRRYLRVRWVIGGTTPNFAGVHVESRAIGAAIPSVPSAT